MSLLKRIIAFFIPNNSDDEIYKLKRRVFELEYKSDCYAQENQKIVVKISSILAQLADDQSTLASHIFKADTKSDQYQSHMDIFNINDDDDLIN